MKKVILFLGIFFMSFLGYSENFKGTDKEFMEIFNPNFDTFTKKDGSVYTGKIEVIRSATGKPWFVMDIKDGKKNGKVVFYFLVWLWPLGMQGRKVFRSHGFGTLRPAMSRSRFGNQTLHPLGVQPLHHWEI